MTFTSDDCSTPRYSTNIYSIPTSSIYNQNCNIFNPNSTVFKNLNRVEFKQLSFKMIRCKYIVKYIVNLACEIQVHVLTEKHCSVTKEIQGISLTIP